MISRLIFNIQGKLEIAQNLIAKGFDEKTILELTEFTVAEVKNTFHNLLNLLFFKSIKLDKSYRKQTIVLFSYNKVIWLE